MGDIFAHANLARDIRAVCGCELFSVKRYCIGTICIFDKAIDVFQRGISQRGIFQQFVQCQSFIVMFFL